MKEKAASVGQGIRSVSDALIRITQVADCNGCLYVQEDGVRTAIAQIYTYLPRAGRDRKSIHN